MIDKKTAKKYQKMFYDVREAILRGESELPKGISLSELSSATQIYTLDESKKYSNVLQSFRRYLFVSLSGVLISMFTGKPYVIKPNILKGREYYRFTVKVNTVEKSVLLSPAALVNLVFGGKASLNAQILLDAYGIMAVKQLERKEVDILLDKRRYPNASNEARELVKMYLRKPKDKYQLVQCNHELGYYKSESIEGIIENREKNNDIGYNQFLFTLEHDAITHAPNLSKDKATTKLYMEKVLNNIPIPNKCLALMPDGNGAGTLYDNVCLEKDGVVVGNEKINVAKTAMGVAAQHFNLVDANGSILVEGRNLPQNIYEDFCSKYVDFVFEFGLAVNAYLGKYEGIEIYGFPEEVAEITTSS